MFQDAIAKAVEYKKNPTDIEDQILEELENMWTWKKMLKKYMQGRILCQLMYISFFWHNLLWGMIQLPYSYVHLDKKVPYGFI